MRKQLVILMAGAMALLLAGCGGSSGSSETQAEAGGENAGSSGEAKVFRISHNFLSNQPLHAALQEVVANIEERTNGELQFEIYENAQIANGVDGVEQCVRGGDLINVYDASCMGDWVPDYNALVGPFLYDTQEEYIELCKTDWAQSLNAQAEEQGIKVLALDYCFGFRHIGTNRKAIRSLEDMKGLKIRVPQSSLWVETFQALGASPTAMGWSEIYNGLQTNVIEGMESSLSDINDNQLGEVLSYITETGHFLGTASIQMSMEQFNALTPEQQQIMEEEFANGAALNNELFDKANEEAQAALEEMGIEFIEVDREPFKEASKAYFDNMDGLSEGVYDTIMGELDKIRAAQ